MADLRVSRALCASLRRRLNGPGLGWYTDAIAVDRYDADALCALAEVVMTHHDAGDFDAEWFEGLRSLIDTEL